MSNELVQRLRASDNYGGVSSELACAAADRIEALEHGWWELHEERDDLAARLDARDKRIEQLEAALRQIKDFQGGDSACAHVAQDVARRALGANREPGKT